ncbi:MAG: secretin N-terminal domain-containing protein [Verrucomicrobiota bacterium]|nr:secretin N-terminal domain-containing protein [Verrucomicrobiota bacterium]
MKYSILFFFVFTVGLISAAQAQTTPTPEPAAAPSATLVEATPSAASDQVTMEMPKESDAILELPNASQDVAPVSREAENITVDFPDEDIRNIIRQVADLYELNVVIPEQLQGRISIKLKDVTWEQVFKVVLDNYGYTYIKDKNIIMIKTKEEVDAEPPVTQVYAINFATAGDLSTSVLPMIDSSKGGRMQVDKRSNALIITEKPSRMAQIRTIIERLDRATEQVMIESKFVEVTNRDIKNIGARWDSLQGYKVQAGPLERQYEKTVDKETKSGETGPNTTSTITIPNTSLPGNTTSASQAVSTTTQSLLNSVAAGRVDTAIFNADAFSLMLSALQTENRIEVVSNPTVVTVNNTPAKINIGEEFPIPNYTYNEQRGSFEVSGFDYKPIGILLKVTPQVNSAGFINLDINPEISSRTGEVSFGGAAGAVIPIITTRKTQSTVTIKSGYTLAIGGLIEKTAGETNNKVPLLGDIPLIGRAFKHKNNTLDKRNLIIFITAKTLNPDGSTYRDVFSQRTLFEMGIKTRDLPGYQPAASEEQLFENIQTARDNLEQVQAETLLRQQLKQLDTDKQKAVKKASKSTSADDNSPSRRKNAP